MRRTADEGRRVAKAAEIPLVDFAAERLRIAKTIRSIIENEGRLIFLKLIQADEILEKIKSDTPVVYKNVVVEGDFDLRKIYPKNDVISSIEIRNSFIQNLATFCKITFRNPVWFNYTQFECGANFDFVRFRKNAVFRGSNFSGYAFFNGVQFDEGAYFEEARFIEAAEFRDAKFTGTANFVESKFYGEANFWGTQFSGYAGFLNAHFYRINQITYFTHVRFKEVAEFQNANFYSNADFSNTQFGRDAEFANSIFGGDVNFTNARFNEYLNFTKTKFDRDLILISSRIRKMRLSNNFSHESKILMIDADFDKIKNIRWNSVKEHLNYERNGDTTYLKLVENFKNLGFFDDADNCYYEYRKAKMREKGRPYLSEFYDVISFLSCGYGVRPDFTIACMFSFIYIFGCLFWYINKITVTKLLMTFIKFYILNSALVFGHIPKFGLQNFNSFLDNFYLSMMVFVGQTPSGFEPVGYLKFATIIEGILGYLFLALFVVVLARKLIR